MELVYVPAQEYVLFIHHGSISHLSLTNQYIWLPQSGHELAPTTDLEAHPATFKPDVNESEKRIPLKKDR